MENSFLINIVGGSIFLFGGIYFFYTTVNYKTNTSFGIAAKIKLYVGSLGAVFFGSVLIYHYIFE